MKAMRLRTITISVFRLVLASSLVALSPAALASGSLWPKIRSPITADPVIEAKIDDLIAQMSIEQKVGQMVQAEIKSITPQDVAKYHIGSILSGGGSWPTEKPDAPLGGWLAMANAFFDASVDTSEDRLAIPIMWGIDAVHGHNNVVGATIFPHNIGLGAANNPALMRNIGAITAREVAVTGIDWVFAPTVAVAQDVRWGRTYESYSENPAIVASLAKELVLGLQGHPSLRNFLSQQKVIATAKHFIGDGGTKDGDDQGNTSIAEADLYKIHGPGYVQTLGVGVQTVMASFSSWNGKKLHGHKYLLTDILKGRMGFDGLVVGDWNGHGQVPGCTDSSCPRAINAGVDLIMVPEKWQAFHTDTVKQVKNGTIPMTRIDDAVRRILRVKFRAGLFTDGRPASHQLAGKASLVGHADHRTVARQAVRESLVLLKNNGVLPVNPAANILVAGSGADSAAMQSGGWTVTWQGRDTKPSYYKGATTIFAGIRKAVEKAGGTAFYSASGNTYKKPDVAIVVFGETPYAEFEGDIEGSSDFELSGNADFSLMQDIKARNIPVVAVFLTGRPRGVDAAIALADAFVVAWLPGSEGSGVADVLLSGTTSQKGYDFKGRLPFSWPGTGVAQPARTDPEYPAGFGLSY